MAGRRIGALGAVVAGQILSAVLKDRAAPRLGERFALLRRGLDPRAEWAAAAFAHATHYKALELGPMAVVSPIGAGYAVVGVVLAIVLLDERPSPLALLGAGSRWSAWSSCRPTSGSSAKGSSITPGLWWWSRRRSASVRPGSCWGRSPAGGVEVGVWGSRMAQLAFYVPMAVFLRRDLGRFRIGVGLWIAFAGADLLGVVALAAGAEQGFVSIVLAASAVFPLIAVALSVVCSTSGSSPTSTSGSRWS